jgi:hypothetical protein
MAVSVPRRRLVFWKAILAVPLLGVLLVLACTLAVLRDLAERAESKTDDTFFAVEAWARNARKRRNA